MDDECEAMLIAITDKLKQVSETSLDKEKFSCIPRVPKHLRDVNEKSFEPQIVAIGPYHRHPFIKPQLQVMEEHKIRCLKNLLRRTGVENLRSYVKAIRKMEGRARACYADVIKADENNFAEMLLLDACFIVELFRERYKFPDIIASTSAQPEPVPENYNPVLDSIWIKRKLTRDLLLVENQLPFFVLEKFFQMTNTQFEEDILLLSMICSFFRLPMIHAWIPEILGIKYFNHLLSFIHDQCIYPFVGFQPVRGTVETQIKDWEFISCATELQEAGIKFMQAREDSLFEIRSEYGIMEFPRFAGNNSLFAIRFENGTVVIPRLTIEHDTESFFRNLIVYEQFYPNEYVLVIDYVKFMDCLINSAKDVELLCQRKILHNCLGDNKAVANMFNRLCNSVTLSSGNYYKDIYSYVNKHCSRRRYKWMANLRHNYFNTPWALVSFLAAVLLLLFTFTQTVFSILSYIKPSSNGN